MKDKKEIGQAIKDFRLNKLEMGLRKFADFMGISPGDLSDIERGVQDEVKRCVAAAKIGVRTSNIENFELFMKKQLPKELTNGQDR